MHSHRRVPCSPQRKLLAVNSPSSGMQSLAMQGMAPACVHAGGHPKAGASHGQVQSMLLQASVRGPSWLTHAPLPSPACIEHCYSLCFH